MTAVAVSTSHQLRTRQDAPEVNLGPFLNVVTWVLLITSTLAVLTRLIIQRALKRRIDVDDAFVVAALVSSARCVAFAFSCLTKLYSDYKYWLWHFC